MPVNERLRDPRITGNYLADVEQRAIYATYKDDRLNLIRFADDAVRLVVEVRRASDSEMRAWDRLGDALREIKRLEARLSAMEAREARLSAADTPSVSAKGRRAT